MQRKLVEMEAKVNLLQDTYFIEKFNLFMDLFLKDKVSLPTSESKEFQEHNLVLIQHSAAYSFLRDEEDLYTVTDLKEIYE